MANDAAALLDHLTRDRTTVLGCSMGGRIALMPALHHRALVDRLVPFPLGQELARRIPGARLVSVPGGHRALFRRCAHAGRLVEEVGSFMGSPDAESEDSD